MLSLHTSRPETKTRLETKVWAVVAVTYLTMLLFVIMWQNFGFWIRKAAGGCKEPLGHLRRSLKSVVLKEMCTVEAQGGIISEPILEEFGQRIELLSVLVQNICQGQH